MTNRPAETSPLIVARVAGLLYLVMGMIGAFSILYVPSTLIVPGDAATTANNIMASEMLFRSGIVSGLLTQIVFILLVLFLYRLLKPVNHNLALLMVIIVLVSVPISMLNELNQFATLLLLNGADYLTAFEADLLHAQVMLFLDLHYNGILISGIFWGLWLFPLGFLVFKSGFLPRILGILLMIGCFGYLIDSFTIFLFPSFKGIAQFTFIGELLLPLWLLIKGVNVEQWQQRALESA
ncbi:MAG: DUF4386 domain-containing protein [Candidatus Marinimicrobia bacterium]|nr:DUF4386 domain-containing protein [Candidatus Neomarinimicrobiota bacterium]